MIIFSNLEQLKKRRELGRTIDEVGSIKESGERRDELADVLDLLVQVRDIIATRYKSLQDQQH